MNFDWIVKYWMQWMFGIVLAGFGVVLKRLSNRVKTFKEQESAEKEALLSLLDDSMGTLFKTCKHNGFATKDEHRRYERLYKAYKALGGNGAVTIEHDKFTQLDIREE